MRFAAERMPHEGISVNIRRVAELENSPSPCPLPQGERVLKIPSLHWRGESAK
jgi:hypothetical protein